MATQGRRGGSKAPARKDENPGQAQGQAQEGNRQRPVHEFRRGRIKAAIWAHTSDDGPWHSVTFSRSYKDGNGNWKSASSFGRDDLLPLGELARKCWDWIYQEQAASRDQANGNGGQGDSYEGGDDEIPV